MEAKVNKKINSYRDLIVWQKAMDLVDSIYLITKTLPKEEIYGLVSQMRRSAISIPSNIAEGSMRGTRKDYSSFLKISLGSTAELNTQIEVSLRQGYINKEEFIKLNSLNEEIWKMLKTIINKLTLKP